MIAMGLWAITSCSSPYQPTRDTKLVEQIEVISTASVGPTFEPYDFRESDPGFATLHGHMVVLDPLTILPASNDAIYLAPMPEEDLTTIPQFIEGEVPQADVDERTGEFVFTNIKPGTYAVVVLSKGGTQFPTRKMADNTFAIFTIDQADIDNIVELGNLSIP
jgi:hypothetical protein